MKISLTFCLAVFVTITVTQIYASEIISKNGNEEVKTENGTDIRVTKPEVMEVILTNHELTFEVCTMNCTTDFLVCYEPDPPEQKATKFLTMCDETCGFYVAGDAKLTEDKDFVGYMGHVIPYLIDKHEPCDVMTMRFTEFESAGILFPSCKPKIMNGMVKLNVSKASTDCPVTIKNAQFKRYPPTTTLLPSNNDSSTSSSGKSSSNVFGIYGWIFVFLSICFLQQ